MQYVRIRSVHASVGGLQKVSLQCGLLTVKAGLTWEFAQVSTVPVALFAEKPQSNLK